MGCLADLVGSVSFGAQPLEADLVARLYRPERRKDIGAVSGDRACFLSTSRSRSDSAPLVSDPAGRVTLFSGYLFDREGLARELGADRSWSDTRLASIWIARHGVERLADLPGDYALSYWNADTRQLFLAISPMGGRLLYWHRAGNICHFSTSVTGLHRIPDVPRILDPLHLTARYSGMVGDVTRTVYKDIYQLLPGNMLVADAAGVKSVTLWQPDPERRLRFARDEEYLEALQELIDRSLARRLQASKSPAFLTSGGMDSAAVLGSAARQANGETVQAYTVVPPPGLPVTADRGRYSDETPKVEALRARYPNLNVTLCHGLDPSPLETEPARLSTVTGLPCLITNQMGWLDNAYKPMQQAGHDAILTGQTGNFTFSYDGQLSFADLVVEGRPLIALRLLRQVGRYLERDFFTMLNQNIVVPFIPNSLYYAQRRWRGLVHPLSLIGLFKQGWMEKVGIDEYIADNGEQALQARDSGSRKQTIHFMLTRRGMGLPNAHAMEVLRGCHIRDVFADRDILEFSLAIPREQYILDGRDRSLARRFLEKQGVSSVITDERLNGQQRVEWNHRFASQLEAFRADIDSFSRDPLISEMFDLQKMRRMLDEWPSTTQPHANMRKSHGFIFAKTIQAARFIRWVSGSNQ